MANVNYKDITDDGLSFVGLAGLTTLSLTLCFAARQSILAAPMLFVIHVARASLNFAFGVLYLPARQMHGTPLIGCYFSHGVSLRCSNLGVDFPSLRKLTVR